MDVTVGHSVTLKTAAQNMCYLDCYVVLPVGLDFQSEFL